MDDDKVRELLDRYRPLGPAGELRDRALRGATKVGRTWPWATAAAVLLAATVAIQVATTSALGRITPPPADSTSALANAMGGGEEAQRAAQLIITDRSIRDAAGLRDVNDELEELINAFR